MYNLAKKFAVPVNGRVRFEKQAAGKQLLLRRVETLVWWLLTPCAKAIHLVIRIESFSKALQTRHAMDIFVEVTEKALLSLFFETCNYASFSML